MIDLAQAEIRFSHEEQAGARIRFLLQHFAQVFNGNFHIAAVATLHFGARAQDDRLSIRRIVLQNRGRFVLRAGDIAVHQHDLGEAIMTLSVVRRFGHDLFVDCQRFVELADCGIEIREDRSTFGPLLVHFGERFVRLFGFFESFIDEIIARQNKSGFAVVAVDLDRFLKFGFRRI